MSDYDQLFKLIIIGDSGVGKSCLLMRFGDDSYTDSYISTIGVDFKIKTVEVAGRTCKLQLWDTAGQDRFRTIVASYYRGCHGVVLVYDITDRESFEHVETWHQESQRLAPRQVFYLLVGTKSDRTEREVSEEEGQQLADRLGVLFSEVSAKTGRGVDAAFLGLVEQLARRPSVRAPPAGGGGVVVSEHQPIAQKKCCN